MARARVPIELIARALTEADFYPDDQIAERWGISRRSIIRYRKELESNPNGELALKVTQYRREYTSRWLDTATRTLIHAMNALEARYDSAKSRDDAECIKAIADSLRAVGELKLAAMALEGEE